MRDQNERTRAEAVRLRRREQTQTRTAKSSVLATRPLPPITSRDAGSYTRPTPPTTRRKYQSSLSMPGIEVRMPAIQITSDGIRSRVLSVLLSLLLGAALYLALTLPEFRAAPAQVTGNQRVSAEEINAALSSSGQPIFLLTKGDLTARLLANFHEFEKVNVTIGLPNRISVNVAERQPVLLWQQENGVTWIDANGVAFRPRGDAPNVIPVAAYAMTPAAPATPANSSDPLVPAPYISPDLVKAIQTIATDVPPGSTVEYDSQNGLGWTDSRGWKVFFGNTVDDMPLKLQVYRSLVDSLTQKGIQPVFISVQYANAPYYRTSQ